MIIDLIQILDYVNNEEMNLLVQKAALARVPLIVRESIVTLKYLS